jgi:ATP-dependent Lon protease
VRNLERQIGSVCRKVAREYAEGRRKTKRRVGAKAVREMLGRPRIVREVVKRRTREPGVATGLAWTPVGGDVLFVEATAFPGEGKLQITGQLGDVMKESAAAALSYVKGHVWRWDADIAEDWFRTHDMHVHVPAGAVPKDGPSAGITMATALVSLVTGRPVRSDVAMTGEITLTGQVLPIGGLKEKSLAAQRAGVTHVIAPKLNEADLDDFPKSLTDEVSFTFVDTVEQVLEHALAKPKRRSTRPSRPRAVAPERAAARGR